MEWKLEIVCPAWQPGALRLIDAIPLLADQGVTEVEMCTNYPRFGITYPDYFDNRDAIEVEILITALHKSGVRVHSVHAPFGTRYDISSPQDNVHESGVEALIESIELASVLDAGIVIVHASDVLSNGSTSKRMDRAHGVLREVAVIAKESGVVIALENLPPGYLGHTPEELFCLIKGTDAGSVGLCFDSGHANMSSHFEEYAQKLLPRAVTIHLHDNNGREDQHYFPGEGDINWHRFAEVYRGCNCHASVMLECEPPRDMQWSAAFQRFRIALGD